MRRRTRLIGLAIALAGALAAALVVGLITAGGAESGPPTPPNKIIAEALAIETGAKKPAKYDLPVSGGVMDVAKATYGTGAGRVIARSRFVGAADYPPTNNNTHGCKNTFGSNQRVNQDCSLRRQAEEAVAVNPTDLSNVIAGQNDSVIGFNHCGYDWSFDNGNTWGTVTPPFWQFILDDGHTSDACSDPTLDWDLNGNAYVGGIVFDVLSPANAVVVMKSNHPIGGSFYHSPAPLSFQEYRTTPVGEVTSTASPDFFHDKELMTVDKNAGSPKKNRVYMTWTRFESSSSAPPFGRSPIVFSQSTNGGATWSPEVIISGASGSFCTVFGSSPEANACDQDQGSHPYVGPDGTIYVVFGNGNTPLVGINQVLMVKCPPVTPGDCTLPTDWTLPTRVGDLIGTHPVGDPGNAGGCPVGRQCLPPNGYRVPEFTSMSISVDESSRLYVTWSDFRNGAPPCTPLAPWSAASPPCNNDVFYAFSLDGGTTWSPTKNVTAPFGKTAQWQPWSEITRSGRTLAVAFYDRHYGNCEFTGCNDITLAEIEKPATSSPSISYRRITSSSMPNLIPANNPLQAGFLGDYMWVDVDQSNTAHIVWADTRPLPNRPAGQNFPEEDVYYDKAQVKG